MPIPSSLQDDWRRTDFLWHASNFRRHQDVLVEYGTLHDTLREVNIVIRTTRDARVWSLMHEIKNFLTTLAISPIKITLVRDDILNYAALCEKTSSGKVPAAAFLRKLASEVVPGWKATHGVLARLNLWGKSFQILLPRLPSHWHRLMEQSYPCIPLTPYVDRWDAPLTDAVILTGPDSYYAVPVGTYTLWDSSRLGSWASTAAPAADLYRVDMVSGTEKPTTSVQDVRGLNTPWHSSSHAALTGPVEARQVLLSSKSVTYLATETDHSILVLDNGTVKDVRQSEIVAGMRLLMREGHSDRSDINSDALGFVRGEAEAAEKLTEDLRIASERALLGNHKFTPQQRIYLKGWAAGALCFPTKHGENARKLASDLNVALTESDIALLRDLRIAKQRAGKDIVENVVKVLSDLGTDFVGDDSVETEAGIFHIRTVVSIFPQTQQVGIMNLGRLYPL